MRYRVTPQGLLAVIAGGLAAAGAVSLVHPQPLAWFLAYCVGQGCALGALAGTHLFPRR